ncbi:MAG: hypothetical protein WCK17_15260 [Verrucomicrobiota bacterium]
MNHSTTTPINETQEQRLKRLWPDPYGAPDVPTRSWLLKYLSGMTPVTSDREAQLAESSNAQRAIGILHAELAFGAAAIEPPIFPSGVGSATNEVAPFAVVSGPVAGQIWTTKGRVRHFDGRRLVWRETFLPMAVILIEKGDKQGDKEQWRVIPASPEELWPDAFLALDESRLELANGEEWVGHLWLETEMPTDELQTLCGDLSETPLVRLRSARTDYQAGRPVSMACGGGYRLNKANQQLLLERERLAERASWLRRTVTALASWEKAISTPSLTVSHQMGDDIAKGIAACWQKQAAAASPESSIFPCFRGEGSKDQLLESLATYHQESSVEQFFAARDARRFPSSPECRWGVEWELRTVGDSVEEGQAFHVYHIPSVAVVGYGFVAIRGGQMFAVLQSGGEQARDPNPAEVALLFPRH